MYTIVVPVIATAITTIILTTLLSRKARCPVCNGTGSISEPTTSGYGINIEECPNCGTRGTVILLNWLIVRIFRLRSFILR